MQTRAPELMPQHAESHKSNEKNCSSTTRHKSAAGPRWYCGTRAFIMVKSLPSPCGARFKGGSASDHSVSLEHGDNRAFSHTICKLLTLPLFPLDLIATCQAVATCKTRSYYGGGWWDHTARHIPTAGLQGADGNEGGGVEGHGA